MYFPFLVCCSLFALSQVCNDASECCRQRRLKRAVEQFISGLQQLKLHLFQGIHSCLAKLLFHILPSCAKTSLVVEDFFQLGCVTRLWHECTMAFVRAAVTRLGFVGSLVAMLGIGSHPIVAGVMHQCPCLFFKQIDSGSSLESVVQLKLTLSLGVLDHCWCGSEVITEDNEQTSELPQSRCSLPCLPARLLTQRRCGRLSVLGGRRIGFPLEWN